MKIVITGATSFVGAHLAKDLGRHHNVLACTSGPLSSYKDVKAARLNYLSETAKTAAIDFCDLQKVEKLLDDFHPDYWIHHGAHTEGYVGPDFDLKRALETNVHPLRGLYSLFQKRRLKGVIVTGSMLEYGPADRVVTESDVCTPNTAYGLSKLASSLYSVALGQEFGIPTVVLRHFLAFGTMNDPQKLPASVVRAAVEKRPIDLTKCSQVRDYIYVGHVAHLYQSVLDNLSPKTSGIYNLSSGKPQVLREFVLSLIEKFGGKPDIARFGVLPMRDYEGGMSVGSSEKFLQTFGPDVNLDVDRGIDAYVQVAKPLIKNNFPFV